MDKSDSISQIHYPHTFNELTLLLSEQERVHLYMGGIQQGKQHDKLDFPSQVASLEYLEEFNRISRTERYMEAGSSANVQNAIERARMILPIPLISLLEKQYKLPLRNQLSLGALFQTDQKSTPLGLLFHLLEILLEIRRERKGNKRLSLKSYWYYYNQYINSEKQEGDILASVRIPLTRWDHHLIREIRFSHGTLNLIILTDLSRGYVSDFRMGFQYMDLPIIRNREWEANILGRKSFFNSREKDGVYEYLVSQGIPSDERYLKPALMCIMDNLLYHFQDSKEG